MRSYENRTAERGGHLPSIRDDLHGAAGRVLRRCGGLQACGAVAGSAVAFAASYCGFDYLARSPSLILLDDPSNSLPFMFGSNRYSLKPFFHLFLLNTT